MQFVMQGFFYTCFCYEWDFIERYKSIEEPWPWKGEDKEHWNNLKKRTAVVYAFNMFVLSPLAYAVSYLLDQPLYNDVSLEGIPSAPQMVTQILFCMMLEDFLFHMGHRTLHHPNLYSHIHKIHHEHKVTIGIAA